MKNRNINWILILFVLSVSCKKDNDDKSPDGSNQVPVPTVTGTALGQPVTGNIDSPGGTITSADGLFEIIIPPGAVTSPTAISIQQITNKCHGGINNAAYRLKPDGLTFPVEVTLRYHYTPSSIAGTDPYALGIAFQLSNLTWTSFRSVLTDTVNKTVSVLVTHFTDFAIFTDWKITPTSADVLINKQKTLTVLHQERIPDPGDEELAPLVGTFQPANDHISAIKNWKVNGNALGNLIDGFLTPSNSSAIYNAPDNVPQINPVAASVEIEVQGRPVMYLVSNLNIVSAGSYKLVLKDNQFNGIICFCQIPIYSDSGSIEFHFDPFGQLIPGTLTNSPPTFSYVDAPPGMCTSVTSPLGTIHIVTISGNTLPNGKMNLSVTLTSETPGVTSIALGTPCDSPLSSGNSILNFNQFNVTDSVQAMNTPLGTNVTLIRLN